MRALTCILDYLFFTFFGVMLAAALLFSIGLFYLTLLSPTSSLTTPAWIILTVAGFLTVTVLRPWSRDLAERYT